MERLTRLEGVQNHQTGKRGGRNYVRNGEKPWLEMKKAQKAQKRARKRNK